MRNTAAGQQGDRDLLAHALRVGVRMAGAVWQQARQAGGSVLCESAQHGLRVGKKHWWVQAEVATAATILRTYVDATCA